MSGMDERLRKIVARTYPTLGQWKSFTLSFALCRCSRFKK